MRRKAAERCYNSFPDVLSDKCQTAPQEKGHSLCNHICLEDSPVFCPRKTLQPHSAALI